MVVTASAFHDKMICMKKRTVLVLAALMLAGTLGIVVYVVTVLNTTPASTQMVLFRLNDQGAHMTPSWVLTVNKDGSGAITNDNTLAGKGNRTYKTGTFNSSSLTFVLNKLNVSDLPTCSQANKRAPVNVDIGNLMSGSFAYLDYKGTVIQSFCSNSPIESEITNQLSNAVDIANP